MSRAPLLSLLAFGCLLGPTSRAQLVARGPWSGALTPYSVEVNLVLFESRLSSLEISKLRDFSRFTTVPEQARRPGDIPRLTRYRLTNLEPDTLYYYRVRAGNVREYQRIGSLRTPPLEGTHASFRLAVAGGAVANSEAGGLAEIGFQKPLFFVQLGNLHNAPIAADNPTGFTDAYLASLGSFARAELMRSVPLVYTWDRYDYGETGRSTALSAQKAFRLLTPHHPFPADQAEALAAAPLDERPVAQVFTIGRVRFIVLDTRSARTTAGDTPTLLGTWQNAWLREELAAADRTHALTLVFSTVPWHAAPADAGIDSWTRFPAEKENLRQWIIEQGVRRLIWLSANTGALAAHAGSRDPFVMPEFQVGDIDLRPAGGPGGEWTYGPLMPEPTEEFFGLVDITDDGSAISATFAGMNQHGRERLRATLTFPVPPL